MVFKAIKFVADAHQGQYRKGTNIPYISHLMNVMKILCENGCDKEIITAGILHDVVEDTSVTIEQVERLFGKRVQHWLREPPSLIICAKARTKKQACGCENSIPLSLSPKKQLLNSCSSPVPTNLIMPKPSDRIMS